MDIVSRLKFFLQENGISNSLFADNCGIPRPTLSQLLNGRNKKVSDELIAKIHASYPALNVMWLLFGDGDMFVPNANSAPAEHAAQLVDNKIDFGDSTVPSSTAPRATTINFDAPVSRPDYREQRPQSSPMQQATMAETIRSITTANASKSAPRNATTAKDSRVVSIMVFYSDGRFETFLPQE